MKRVAASVLWFWVAWTAGAFLDYVAPALGGTAASTVGVILGCAVAALVAIEPSGLIWKQAEPKRGTQGTTTANTVQASA